MRTSRKFLLMALSCSVLLGSSNVLAAPSCEFLQHRWDEYFRYGYEFDANFTPLTCGGVTEKVVLALNDLENLDFRPTGNYKPNFSKYVHDVVRRISYSESGYCAGNSVIAHSRRTSAHKSGGNVTFCPLILNHSREFYAMALIHESAHLYVGDPGHVICEAGEYKGDEACDDVLYQDSSKNGAHGQEVFFVHWVSVAATSGDFDAAVLKREAKDLFKHNFNAFETSRGLIRSRDIYDGKVHIDGVSSDPDAVFSWIIKDMTNGLQE